MTQDEAFLRAIVEEPDDDTHRLVYADWLEEHGKADRAEFIRVQCELARLRHGDARRAELESREQALLAAHQEEWTEMLPRAVTSHAFERGFLSWVEMPAGGFSHLRSALGWFPTI